MSTADSYAYQDNVSIVYSIDITKKISMIMIMISNVIIIILIIACNYP